MRVQVEAEVDAQDYLRFLIVVAFLRHVFDE